jgi:purine-binding chemotaxis protein CheW
MMTLSESERRQQVDAALAERARLLARPIVELGVVPTVDLVEFSAGNAHYAIEAAFVHRLGHLGRVTTLPGAARHFAGITNLHGQLVPLVDLGMLLGAAPCASAAFVVVLGELRAEIGIVAETLLEIRALPLHALGTPAPAPRPIVRRIISDGTAVIDGAALLADPRLVVGELAAGTTYEENAP